MTTINRRRFGLAIAGLSLVVASLAGHAQGNWPNKPVHLVVAAAPGGSTDLLGRLYGQLLSDKLGQPVIVENRGGAGGSLAAVYVAKSPADGYTLLMTNDQLVVQASFPGKITYDPLKDFTPVSLMARGPVLLGVNPSVKANTVAELIALARAEPGKLAFASCGNGTVLQLAGELLNLSANIKMPHIPYRGCSPAMADVVANQVPVFFTVFGNAVPFAKSGKVRLLGVASSQRLPDYPDLPTISEAGLKGFIAEPWFGLLAPAGTPKDIVDKLSADINAISRPAEMSEKIRSFYLEPASSSPEEFGQIMVGDLNRWSKVIRDAKITLE